MSRIARVALSSTALLAWGAAAHAGEEQPLSDIIDGGWAPVLVVHTDETTCGSFQVDERGNRWSDYETWASVEEVLSQGEGNPGPDFVVGESILLHWTGFSAGVPDPDAEQGGGCSWQYVALRDDQVRAFAMTLDGDRWVPDAWSYDDLGYGTPSDTPLPDCGEDLQQQIMEEVLAAQAEEEDIHAAEDDGASADAPGGCSVLPGSQAGGLALALGLVGLARRRRG